MKLKTIKTSELEGAALDGAVAKAVGVTRPEIGDDGSLQKRPRIFCTAGGGMGTMPYKMEYRPSTDWSVGGPLIADGVYMLCRQNPLFPIPVGTEGWIAAHEGLPLLFDGPTPLIAACRAIVAAKLGDEVEVPEELV